MLTKRGWSYSRRRSRRVRRTLGALGLPLVVAAVVVGAAAYASRSREVSSNAPLAVGETGLPATLAPTLAPTPEPTLAPTVAPTVEPSPTPVPQKPLLPEHRIVAYYGNPLAKEMGVLGELDPDTMLGRLQQQATAYASADAARPVVPALELVTPAAQGYPGDDGLYRARMKPEVIERVAAWAESRHALLILDVQIGRSTVPQEVEAVLPYLSRPYVHLALDPEFAMSSGGAPGDVIGSLDGAVIDGAIHTLSDLVASQHLPPKILIVHRFTQRMVTNAWSIKPDANVQVIITMDGFGPPGLKLAQYHEYVHNQAVQYSGIKLFYHHDVPLLSPPEVLKLDPTPDLVIYQ